MDKIALIVGYEKLEKENKRLQRDHDALLADVGRVSKIRQELERELIGVKAVVETFIRCVHADGDSDMDWGKLPTLLDAIEDYVDEGREALAIVAKLPRCNRLNDNKTALVQECPVVEGMEYFGDNGYGIVKSEFHVQDYLCDENDNWYTTKEAAKFAQEGTDEA